LRLEISLEKEDHFNIRNQKISQRKDSRSRQDIKAVASEKAA
jgi:hypothetical protein